jgi:hypothetical protein
MTTPTHAISIRQPWLELILRGRKTVEFRSWRAPERHVGVPIALAATAQPEAGWNYILGCRATDPPPPCGVILAIATIIWQTEFALPLTRGNDLEGLTYEPGFPGFRCDTDNRWWAWRLRNIVPVEPIPCRGLHRFWQCPDDMAAQLCAALQERAPC